MIVLRRTPFKRPVPPARPARQWTGALPSPRPVALRLVPVSGVVVPIQKEAPLRDEAYRRYTVTFPCMACNLAGLSQAAHPNFGKGLSLKTDDRLCFPLCGPSPLRVGCHTQHDLCIDMNRDERREREAGYIARMQAQARADGWQV